MTAETPTSAPRLIDGPDTAPATVLLAHGAGAPMDSPFMAAIAAGLAAAGWRVVRFEFAYMARMRETGRRQGPDRMPVLQEAFRQQVRLEKSDSPERPLFIGGKSMGGRVASLLVEELAASDGVRGCLCLGYPFHPPGKPLQLRTEHLAALRTPTLILQGERDTLRPPRGGGDLQPLAGGAAGLDPQRRPQLQAHPQFGAERGGELGHGGGVERWFFAGGAGGVRLASSMQRRQEATRAAMLT